MNVNYEMLLIGYVSKVRLKGVILLCDILKHTISPTIPMLIHAYQNYFNISDLFHIL